MSVEDGQRHDRDGDFRCQKRYASHLHYDFRLELDEVLKSRAVPKMQPTNVGIKHRAEETEDHSLSYADFEVIIPEGQYGAGKIEI